MTLSILHGSGVMNIGYEGLAESHTKGFGQELRWDTLGAHRTVAAAAVQRCLHARDRENGVPQVYHELEHMANNGRTEALKNWIVAWIPIALGDAVNTAHGIDHEPTKVFDVVKAMALSVPNLHHATPASSIPHGFCKL